MNSLLAIHVGFPMGFTFVQYELPVGCRLCRVQQGTWIDVPNRVSGLGIVEEIDIFHVTTTFDTAVFKIRLDEELLPWTVTSLQDIEQIEAAVVHIDDDIWRAYQD